MFAIHRRRWPGFELSAEPASVDAVRGVRRIAGIRLLLLAVLPVLLGGCLAGELEDLSTSSPYAPFVGQRLRLLLAVDAYGIRGEGGKEQVSYATLIPSTIAIAGPEVAFKHRLPAGTMLSIVGVKKRRTLLASNTFYDVAIDGRSLPSGVPVRLELSRGNEGSGWAALNPTVYERATQ